jgi:hypothetical protein
MIGVDHGSGRIERRARTAQLNVVPDAAVVRGQRAAAMGSTGCRARRESGFVVRPDDARQHPASVARPAG